VKIKIPATAPERVKAAEAAAARGRDRLVGALRDAALSFAECDAAHRAGQAAAEAVGPGTPCSAPDPSTWHFLAEIAAEASNAAFAEIGNPNQPEAARVTLQLRVPRLDEVNQ